MVGAVQRSIPPYRQIAAALREQITSGQYEVGHRIPTVMALVAQFGASRMTVQQSLRLLKNGPDRVAG